MVEALAAGTPVVALARGRRARHRARRGRRGADRAKPRWSSSGRRSVRWRSRPGTRGELACARARVLDRALSRANARVARRGVARRHAATAIRWARRIAAAMRIGIDARNDGPASAATRSRSFASSPAIDRENEYVLFLRRRALRDVRPARTELPRGRGRHPVVHAARAAAAAAPRRARATRPRPLPQRDGPAARDDAVRRHDPRPQLPRRGADLRRRDAEVRRGTLLTAGYRLELAKGASCAADDRGLRRHAATRCRRAPRRPRNGSPSRTKRRSSAGIGPGRSHGARANGVTVRSSSTSARRIPYKNLPQADRGVRLLAASRMTSSSFSPATTSSSKPR